MKTAKYIALTLMCVSLVATAVVGYILLDRVMGILKPAAPQQNENVSTPPSSSSTPVSEPSSVPPSSSTIPIHQCDFTTKGNTYEPTCDMMGYTVYFCQCGKADYGDYVDSLGHLYGEYTTVPHTCTQDGWTERTCSRCNRTEKTDLTSAAHTFTSWAAAEDPNRECRDCTVCGCYELRSTIDGEKWTIATTPLGNVGGFEHFQVTLKPSKNAEEQEHHLYVGFPDANIRFEYTEGYLLIRYTFNGEEKANIMPSEFENLTLQPIGTLVPGKPAAA